MLQNIQRELRQTRQEVIDSLMGTMPSKEFTATIMMAMVALHVIEARIHKTQNLEERRQLIDEFNKGRNTIEKGIQLLKKNKLENSKIQKPRLGECCPDYGQ